MFSTNSEGADPVYTRKRQPSLGSSRKMSCCQPDVTARACCNLSCCTQHQHHYSALLPERWSSDWSDSKQPSEPLAHPLPPRQYQTPPRKHHPPKATWVRLGSAHPPTIQPIPCALQLSSFLIPEQRPAIHDLFQRNWPESVAGGLLFPHLQNLIMWWDSKYAWKRQKMISSAGDYFDWKMHLYLVSFGFHGTFSKPRKLSNQPKCMIFGLYKYVTAQLWILDWSTHQRQAGLQVSFDKRLCIHWHCSQHHLKL